MVFKKLTYIVLAAVLALPLAISCRKGYEIFDDLAVTSHTLEIAQTPGETHIAVYSTGAWKVAFDKNVDWASLNKLSGRGLGDFVLSWSANYGTSRSVDILVTRDDLTERITVIQAGYITSPYIQLDRSKVVLPRQEASLPVAMTTNLGFSVKDFRARAVYYGGAKPDTLEVGAESEKAWIRSCEIQDDKIVIGVAANGSGSSREALLVCYMKDAAGIETKAGLSIVQTASDPVLKLSATSGDYYSNSGTYTIPATSNNIWSLGGVTVTADVPWIRDMAVIEEGLRFSVDENPGGALRSGNVTVSYTSAGGLKAGASFKVSQAREKMLSFSELRSRVPGTIHGAFLIEGYIVSDPSSPNVCSSPQTGQFAFDRTENDRTAYLESVDASLGICLKFKDASENVFPRWSRVIVNLDGASLERESSPMRFTLGNVTASMIKLSDDASPVPVKQKVVAQLTDDDIYTYVSLRNVEILFKDGCYTNASEGYSMKDELNPLGADLPRWDVAPLLCSDANGDAIHILTNAAAPWRRTGNDVQWYSCLPQGSGTLGGVIVSDDVAPVRWGKLGKYQIRPMEESDIDLSGLAFSNIICEWNWNDAVEKLTPDIGKGTLQKYDAATKFTSDYNNPYLPAEDSPNGYDTKQNMKGLVSGAALCLTQNWWDFELNQGKYFDVEFSTAGVSGDNIVLGIVWGHGLSASTLQAPSHWKVLYSLNGTTFYDLPSAGILKQRSCAWWSSPQTSQDAAPGYTEHLVKLPQTCFGRNKVVVRFQAADQVTDIAPSTSASTWRQALGIEQGTLTPSSEGPVRIGAITVRFN